MINYKNENEEKMIIKKKEGMLQFTINGSSYNMTNEQVEHLTSYLNNVSMEVELDLMATYFEPQVY